MTATNQETPVFEYGFGDVDEYGDDFECLCDALTHYMQKLNESGKWAGRMSNFGWRRLNGFLTFEADNGRDFLQAILPKTDCSFRIFVDEKDGEIRIQNYHHDSPVGNEWYYIRPATCCESCGEILDRPDDFGDFDLAPHRMIYADKGKKAPVCEYCAENWDWDFVEKE